MATSGILSILIMVMLSFILLILIVHQKLSRMIKVIKENRRYLYTLLEWRFQLMDALRELVQEQMGIHNTLLAQFDEFNQKAQTAKKQKKFQEFMRAENTISHIIAKLDSVFEQQAILQSNTQALELKEDVIGLQAELDEVITIYNRDLDIYNKTKSVFLDSLVMFIFPKSLKINFPYWKMDGKMKLAMTKIDEVVVENKE